MDWKEEICGIAENERRELKAKLLQILEREERAVQMKNKFTWAKEGDANTKLFHLLQSARKMKNSMTKIKKETEKLQSQKGKQQKK